MTPLGALLRAPRGARQAQHQTRILRRFDLAGRLEEFVGPVREQQVGEWTTEALVERDEQASPQAETAHREIPVMKAGVDRLRLEERRVGKECRSRWSPY